MILNKTFQSVLIKDQDHQAFKPVPKICGEMYKTYDDISKSINHLTDKIIGYMTIQIRTIQVLLKILKELYLKIQFEIKKNKNVST